MKTNRARSQDEGGDTILHLTIKRVRCICDKKNSFLGMWVFLHNGFCSACYGKEQIYNHLWRFAHTPKKCIAPSFGLVRHCKFFLTLFKDYNASWLISSQYSKLSFGKPLRNLAFWLHLCSVYLIWVVCEPCCQLASCKYIPGLKCFPLCYLHTDDIFASSIISWRRQAAAKSRVLFCFEDTSDNICNMH